MRISVHTAFFAVVIFISLFRTEVYAQLYNNGGILYVSDSAHLTVNQASVYNYGSTSALYNYGVIYVNGNVSNGSGASLTNNDSLIVTGNFNDSANYLFSAGKGTLNLSGASGQQFISRGKTFYNNLVLSGGGLKTLSGKAILEGSFEFYNGIITVGTLDTLGMDSLSNTAISGTGAASSASYVSGWLFRKKAGANVYFPIGRGGNFRPVNLVNVTGGAAQPIIGMVLRNNSFGIDGPNVTIGSALSRFNIHWRMTADANYKGSQIQVSYVNSDYSGGSITTADLVVAQTDSLGSVIKWNGIGQSAITSAALNTVTSAYNATNNFYTIGFCKNLQLNIKAWLQGPYNVGTSLMTPIDIDTLNYYYGTNGTINQMYQGSSIPVNAVDVITLYLRNGPTGTYADSTYAWLIQDGSIRDYYTGTNTFVTFCNTSPASYNVVVRHRNHLAIMSSGGVSLVAASSSTIDMTGIANIYGAGAAYLNGSNYGMFAGNAHNIDQQIDAWDLYNVVKAQNALVVGYTNTDVNLDLVTNASDYNITSTGNDNLYFSTVP